PTPRPPTPALFPYTTLFRSRCPRRRASPAAGRRHDARGGQRQRAVLHACERSYAVPARRPPALAAAVLAVPTGARGARSRAAARDRKSTRLNSSHVAISYAV